MKESNPTLPTQTSGAEFTRFNALRHGVLSRYTVLPWEDADEYHSLVAALAAEHAPQGPTEEHLVEELAGVLWRKRRLRLAEAAAHRHGLEETFSPHRKTKQAALAHLRGSGRPRMSATPSAQRRPTQKKIWLTSAPRRLRRAAPSPCSTQCAATPMRPHWRL